MLLRHRRFGAAATAKKTWLRNLRPCLMQRLEIHMAVSSRCSQHFFREPASLPAPIQHCILGPHHHHPSHSYIHIATTSLAIPFAAALKQHIRVQHTMRATKTR